MRLNKLIIGVAVLLATMTLTTRLDAQTAPPGQLTGQIPGLAAYSTNGLSFTNVNYKLATGMKTVTAGGTLAFAEADADLSQALGKPGKVDFGAAAELTLSSAGNGLHDVSIGPELINNISNWQLGSKVLFRRTFEENTGNYLGFGFDISYNLTKGAGISFLPGANNFTYVGGGVRWLANLNSLNGSMNQGDIEKEVVIFAGVAF